MSKQFWVQFDFAAFLRDTDGLSNQAVGGWQRALCRMFGMETGALAGDWQYWARIMRCSPQEAQKIIAELEQENICNVQRKDGKVTLVSRRLSKQYKEKENNRLRKQRQRANAAVTPMSQNCHGPVVKDKDKVKVKKEMSGPSVDKSVDNSTLGKETLKKLRFIFSTFNFPLTSYDRAKLVKLADLQLKKSLSDQETAQQLDNIFCWLIDYENEDDDNPRYVRIESKAHLWNVLFKCMDKARKDV